MVPYGMRILAAVPRTRSRAITPYSPQSQEQSDYLGVVRSSLLITLYKTLSLKLVLMVRSVRSFQRNSSLAVQRRTSPGIYTLTESQPLWSHDRQKKLPNHLTPRRDRTHYPTNAIISIKNWQTQPLYQVSPDTYWFKWKKLNEKFTIYLWSFR